MKQVTSNESENTVTAVDGRAYRTLRGFSDPVWRVRLKISNKANKKITLSNISLFVRRFSFFLLGILYILFRLFHKSLEAPSISQPSG